MSLRDRNISDSGLLAASPPRQMASDDGVGLWLDGENVLCACPDCGAANNIRLWLMVADCWRCGTGIELTSVAQETIERRVRENADAGPGGSTPNSSMPTRGTRVHESPAPAISPEPGRQPVTPPAASLAFAADQRQIAPPHQFIPETGLASSSVDQGHWLSNLQAWLTSLVVHLLLLILLAIWVQHNIPIEPTITLSMAVSKHRVLGDRSAVIADEARFDLPAPDDNPPTNRRERDAIQQANQDAKPLQIDPDSIDPNLASLDRIKTLVQSSRGQARALATRDPRLRRELIHREGGTMFTEAAVARGLHWLAQQQNADGSWYLQGHGDRSAGTSLALLPFLGAGQTHLVGIYKDTVSGGLRYLLESQAPDGSLRGDANKQHYMYVHGQATIVLCETFAMTHDERFRQPAQQAIDFIVAAQYPRGGWRYKPRRETRDPRGDTSVFGWQVMALQSGRMAGLDVPTRTLQLAQQYLDIVSKDDGATYGYQVRRRATHAMTAEAQLCRIYLGWPSDHPALQRGVQYLLEETPVPSRRPNYYYWYYATQVMHHIGGTSWRQWNRTIRETLVELQRTRGPEAGSWPNNGQQRAGELYTTAMAVCTLEVYYRHAPIFRRIVLE